MKHTMENETINYCRNERVHSLPLCIQKEIVEITKAESRQYQRYGMNKTFSRLE